MKNNNIEALFAQRDQVDLENMQKIQKIDSLLLVELSKLWDDSTLIQKDLVNAESASLYQAEEDGIYSWFRASSLERIEKRERDYFDQYASDHGISRVDWNNDCLMIFQGDDNIVIQKEFGPRGNGVFEGGSEIITDDEMRVDGEFSDEKIGFLIERHMEKSGYFPGVFVLSYHGDIVPFDSRKNAMNYKPKAESDDE